MLKAISYRFVCSTCSLKNNIAYDKCFTISNEKKKSDAYSYSIFKLRTLKRYNQRIQKHLKVLTPIFYFSIFEFESKLQISFFYSGKSQKSLSYILKQIWSVKGHRWFSQFQNNTKILSKIAYLNSRQLFASRKNHPR